MPVDNRGYFTAEQKSAEAEPQTVQTSAVAALQTSSPSPAPVAATATVAAVPPVQHVSHPALDKLFQILTALEPFLLAAAVPFIKNPNTVAIIQNEAPVAQAITSTLSNL